VKYIIELIKEGEDKILYKKIKFDSLEEKIRIRKEMTKDDWEDLDSSSETLTVVFRKYVELFQLI